MIVARRTPHPQEAVQILPQATNFTEQEMKSLEIERAIKKVEFDLKFYNEQLEIAKKNKKFFNRKIADALTEKLKLQKQQEKYSKGIGLDKFFKNK